MTTTVYATQDVYTAASSPNTNFEGNDLLVYGSGSRIYSYIEFDLSSFAGKDITEAMIKLFIVINNLTSDTYIRFHRIDHSWDASEATYNDPPSVDDYEKIKTLENEDSGWEQWNVTNLVEDIISNGGYGIRVEIDANQLVQFSSIEGGDSPKLVITEVPMTCTQSFTASADIGDLPFHPYFNMFKGTTFIGQYQTSASLTLDTDYTYTAEPLVPVGQEENWTAPDNVAFVACVGAINFEYIAIECPTPICSFRIN